MKSLETKEHQFAPAVISAVHLAPIVPDMDRVAEPASAVTEEAVFQDI